MLGNREQDASSISLRPKEKVIPIFFFFTLLSSFLKKENKRTNSISELDRVTVQVPVSES